MTTRAAPLSDEITAELDYTLEHFNGNHPDTVLFLAQHCGNVPLATDAEALTIDSEGVNLSVRIDGQLAKARLTFAEPATTVVAIRSQLLDLIGAARGAAGKGCPLTSLEEERSAVAELQTFVTSVQSVEALSPNLRRVIVSGGLEGYEPKGGDEFVYLMVPRADGDATISKGFTMTNFQAAPDATRPYGAYYTVRHFDSDQRSIELWLVLHDHTNGVGGWAASASSGTEVALWGPRRSFTPPESTSSYLFVVDESGLAAVARLIDEMEDDCTAIVVAEVVDATHQIVLSDSDAVTVHWVHRGARHPGDGTALIDAVRELDLHPTNLAAFGAAESRQITTVRKYLRSELKMAADHVFMTGYWRR